MTENLSEINPEQLFEQVQINAFIFDDTFLQVLDVARLGAQ